MLLCVAVCIDRRHSHCVRVRWVGRGRFQALTGLQVGRVGKGICALEQLGIDHRSRVSGGPAAQRMRASSLTASRHVDTAAACAADPSPTPLHPFLTPPVLQALEQAGPPPKRGRCSRGRQQQQHHAAGLDSVATGAGQPTRAAAGAAAERQHARGAWARARALTVCVVVNVLNSCWCAAVLACWCSSACAHLPRGSNDAAGWGFT